MKSKDLQKLVLAKYEAGQTSKKTLEDLNGAVSYRPVKRWCKMIRETDAIDLSTTIRLSQNSSYEGSPYKRSKGNSKGD